MMSAEKETDVDKGELHGLTRKDLHFNNYRTIVFSILLGYSSGALLAFGVPYYNLFSRVSDPRGRTALTLFGLGVLGASLYCSRWWAKDLERAVVNTLGKPRDACAMPTKFDAWQYLFTIFGGGITGIVFYIIGKYGVDLFVSAPNQTTLRPAVGYLLAIIGGFSTFEVEDRLKTIFEKWMSERETAAKTKAASAKLQADLARTQAEGAKAQAEAAARSQAEAARAQAEKNKAHAEIVIGDAQGDEARAAAARAESQTGGAPGLDVPALRVTEAVDESASEGQKVDESVFLVGSASGPGSSGAYGYVFAAPRIGAPVSIDSAPSELRLLIEKCREGISAVVGRGVSVIADPATYGLAATVRETISKGSGATRVYSISVDLRVENLRAETASKAVWPRIFVEAYVEFQGLRAKDDSQLVVEDLARITAKVQHACATAIQS